MTPIRLWSVDVIHSLHRYGHQPLKVINATTAPTTSRTTMDVINGIGWFNGTASQVSFPNRFTLPSPAMVG